MGKTLLVKSPLTGYWVIQSGGELFIELFVKTKQAAINKARKRGYEPLPYGSDEVLRLTYKQ